MDQPVAETPPGTAESAFMRYEAVRHRLPTAQADGADDPAPSLAPLMGEADAFVFDAYGVLNRGPDPLPGAAARIAVLRAAGKAVRVLTNAASFDRPATMAKFAALGFDFTPDEIVTSREAALAALDTRLWGVIAAPGDRLADIAAATTVLADEMADFERAEGVLFLSTAGWSEAHQQRLEASLARKPRPVLIANADLVAPQPVGFSVEPGYWGHRIADRGLAPVRFFGKPFPEVFETVEASLPGLAPHRILMCGDTLHTDILGAAAHGWRTVLVTEAGLFAGHDAGVYVDRSGIRPDWRVPRI